MGGSSEAQAVINAKTSKHVGEQSQQAVMLHIVLDLLVHVRHTCCYTVRSSLPLLSHFYDNVPCLQQNFRCTSEEKVTCTSGETHVYKRVVLLYIIHTYVICTYIPIFLWFYIPSKLKLKSHPKSEIRTPHFSKASDVSLEHQTLVVLQFPGQEPLHLGTEDL